MAYEYRCEICHELVTGSDDEVLACPAHPSAGVMSCPVNHVSAVAAEQAPACESGTATGEPCAWAGDADELETVEWMPEHLRSSHEAAGNWGEYPFNGAERLRCCPACAEMLQAEQDEAR